MNSAKTRYRKPNFCNTPHWLKAQSRSRKLFAAIGLPLLALAAVIFTIVFFINAKTKAGSLEQGRATAFTPALQGRISSFLNRVLGGAPRQPRSLGLKKGDRLTYQLSQTRAVRIKGIGTPPAAVPGTSPAEAELRIKQGGDLIARIYDENEKGWTAGFELKNTAIEISDGHPSHQKNTGAMLPSPEGEMLTFILKSGRIQKMTAPANMPAEQLNQWRDILARWQVILADDAADAEWSRTEEDTTGVYVANYKRIETGKPEQIKKRKNHYLNIKPANQAAIAVDNTIEGETTIHLNPYQTSIDGHENLLIEEMGISTKVDFSFRLKSSFKDRDVIKASPERVALLNSTKRSLSWAGESLPNSKNFSLDVDSGTIQMELANLKKLLEDGKGGTVEEVKALEKIAALIRRDDASNDAILDELAKDSTSTDLASALIGVLGAAGTPAAQMSLLAIATTDDMPDEQREMALFSFAQVTDPISEVDRWLQLLHQKQGSLAGNALLVLAAMGDRVRDADPDRFNSISKYVLLTCNAHDFSLDAQILALDAIGNLGPQQIPSLVQTALSSDDPAIRQKAVMSLQRIQTDNARSIVMDLIVNDPADSVRAAGVKLFADGVWNIAPDVLMNVAANDPSAQVRCEALMSMSQSLDYSPKIKETLDRISATDPSQEVRELAAQLLASETQKKQF